MAFTCVWKVLAAVLVINGVLAVPAPQLQDNEISGRSNEDGNWNIVMKIFESCEDKDMLSCLGVKAVSVMDRASRMANIEIVDGITFVGSNVEDSRAGRALLTEAEIQNSIETAPSGKTARLLDMIMESVTRFFKTHSLQFKLPEAAQEGIQRAFEEGRKKKFKLPKRLSPLLMAFGAKLALLVPLALAATKFLVIKALIVAKLALLIAGALAVQKLISGGGLSSLGSLGGGGHSSPVHSSGWSSGGGGSSSYSPSASGGWSQGGSYSRSIDEDAHQLAYAAQAPEHVKAQ